MTLLSLLRTVGIVMAVGEAACGGNVVVDVGSPGHGGGITSSTSVGSTSSTSTGTTSAGSSCDCTQFCATVAICLPLGSCMDACAQHAPSVVSCACAAGVNDCPAVQACWGM